MKDEELDAALRGLPRQRASHGFTQRLLVRLDEPQRDVVRPRLVRLAVAAALVLVLVPAILWWRDRVAYKATQEQVLALRAEHEDLKRRLEASRIDRGESLPMVVIGGDDRVDYVIPLETLLTGRPIPRPPESEVITVPAIYTEGPL